MTDGTDRPHTPQPTPGNGNGGYGFPPGQTPGSGYGYPQPGQPNPYQQSQPQPGPQPGPQSQPQPGPQPWAAGLPPQAQRQPLPDFTPAPQPDWEAMADRSESQRRTRRRTWTIAIAVVATLLGVGAGFIVIEKTGKKDKPEAGPTQSAGPDGPGGGASGSPDDNSPTVPGDPKLLRDRSGQVNIALGPDAVLGKVDNGNVLRLRSNGNSYAQAADQVVDASKSFTVSAWVYNEAEGGSRFALSQGDGTSYSFELGREDANGKKSWVFRMQTNDKGAASTAVAAQSENLNTVRTWAQLTGVYDAEKKTIVLYVDGKPAGQAAVPTAWNGPGPLQLGRSRHHGIWTGPWAGVIGHVLVWEKPLSADQVAALKGGKLDKSIKPVGSWLVG
ncbi:LamG domain-containing protein [Streptomyces sp. NPDC090022]|uniref:LamG domain-containing protein n=1 Tax=Streptomyces sp. NPDC090022 TaxID=3365920 RepID=UPI0038292789